MYYLLMTENTDGLANSNIRFFNKAENAKAEMLKGIQVRESIEENPDAVKTISDRSASITNSGDNGLDTIYYEIGEVVPEDKYERHWESFSDDNVLLLSEESAFDIDRQRFFALTKLENGQYAYQQGTIYVDAWLTHEMKDALASVLSDNGFDSLDDFVLEYGTTDGSDWVRFEDGTVDIDNSPSYIIDYQALASFIVNHLYIGTILGAEHPDVPVLDKNSAMSLAKLITGEDIYLD